MTHDTQLIRPRVDLAETHTTLIQEFRKRGESLVPWILNLDTSNFETYVRQLSDNSLGIGIKPGFVRHATFWLVDVKGLILGVANLRHRLTPKLRQVGGHIGFGIRPSERRKGHATRLLALTLREAQPLGIDRVLLTCDKGNRASEKVILANGGVLDKASSDEKEFDIQRFWIDLS
jgi:predicted acetyltransferase